MHYDDQIYRPPFEANTLLLQVTSGCSHNACGFCHMYRNVPFRRSPEAEIRADLAEAATFYQTGTRIYLLNGDPFALSAAQLLAICAMIHEYLPAIEVITMYASVDNILRKSDDELAALRDAGINDLYLGIESGHDEVLTMINKGHTAAQARQAMERLEAVGIRYIVMIITGVAGAGRGEENAQATAKLLHGLQPKMVTHTSMVLQPGTEMYAAQAQGTFAEPSERERLQEMYTVIKNLQGPTYYTSQHVSNSLAIYGRIPENRNFLLLKIDDLLDNYDEEDIRQRHNRNITMT